MLTDKEVGELLKGTQIFGSDYNGNGAALRSYHLKRKIRELVIKLVDERAMMLVMRGTKDSSLLDAREQAIKEFGIEERDWT